MTVVAYSFRRPGLLFLIFPCLAHLPQVRRLRFRSIRIKMPVWPYLIPFLSLIKSRVRRPGPDSESASRIASQSVRVAGSPGFPSHGSESASGRVGSFASACNAILPPECFSLLAVRGIPLPQGGGRTRSWSWAAAATTLLDEVYAFLRVAGWRARSWS